MSAAVELLYTGLWHWEVASASASAHSYSDPRFWQSHYLHQLKLNFVTQHCLCFCHIGSLVLSSLCASCFSASPWPLQHHRYAFYRCYISTLYSKILQIKLPCHLHTIILYAHFSSDLSVSNAFTQLVTNQAGSLLDLTWSNLNCWDLLCEQATFSIPLIVHLLLYCQSCKGVALCRSESSKNE